MYGYIYKTTNLENKKFYIGQKKSQIFLDEKYLGSGVRLNSAITHYGKDKFIVELIDDAQTKDELDEKEIFWIETLDARNPDIGYNISKGGDGNSSGIAWNKGLTKKDNPKLIQSNETIQKRRESLKKAYAEGRHSTAHSVETKKVMSEKAKLRPHPPTTSNTVCYTDGIHNKMLKIEDIQHYIELGWVKGKTMSGKPAWNKGLTKETNEIMSKIAKNRKEQFAQGKSIGCYGVKHNNFQKGGKLKDFKSN